MNDKTIAFCQSLFYLIDIRQRRWTNGNHIKQAGIKAHDEAKRG